MAMLTTTERQSILTYRDIVVGLSQQLQQSMVREQERKRRGGLGRS